MPIGSCKRVAAFAVVSLLLAVAHLHAQVSDAVAIQAAMDTATVPANTPGTIQGIVFDKSFAVIPNATVTLTRDGDAPITATTDANGAFSFTNISAGKFHIAVAAAGFEAHEEDGNLLPGEIHSIEQINLAPANAAAEVVVHAGNRALAIQQVHQEEQQRVLGFIPNYYVVYNHEAVALPAQEKFQLAGRYFIDPVNLAANAGLAGIEEASNTYSSFGTGAAGYGKYLAAQLATSATSNFLAGAVFPSVLHQDPRYYVKGTGTVRARLLYALANSVICKGDNRRWQANYSGLLGGLTASGISNFYYPAANRNGVALTFQNFGFGLIGSAGANIFQEFFSRRMSTGIPKSF